jgi:hypothetical protein
MYQRIAVAFVIGTFLLLLVVLYLSVSRATIHVVPSPKLVSTTAEVQVVPSPVAQGDMTGVVVEQTFSQVKTFNLPSDGGTPVSQKSTGIVTLINKTSSPQTLVATTRLLSNENATLFRLDNYTTVPANGQIETTVHADQPGTAGDIGPVQFTIPGLSQSQQKDIYAVSINAMTGGVAYVHILTEQDLNDAVNSLTDEIVNAAKTTLATGVDRSIFAGEAYRIEVLERKSDKQPGTETGSFNVSLSVKIGAVYYGDSLLREAVGVDLVKRLPTDYVMSSVNADGLLVTVNEADAQNNTASLSVYLDGVGVIAETAEVFAKERFVGRSAQEVVTLLSASEGVASTNVTFTPFWLRRIPTLQDHISLDIQAPAAP